MAPRAESPSDDHPARKPAALLPHGPAVDAAAAERARVARGWLHTAHFLTSAPQLEHLPPLDLPEIAFVGRSNAGKSTAINTLTQQTRLAFASKTPGRTQHINLFGVGKQKVDDAVLADLPGYGYAAVPREAKLRWQRVMGNYLMTRESLRGVVLMCDPRHGLTELDDILLDVIRPRVEQGLKFLVLLTKADKLTRSEGAKALSIARLQAGGGEVKLFSALKQQGVDEAAELLWRWAHPAGRACLARTDEGDNIAMIETFAARASQRHHAQLPRGRRSRTPADGVPARLSRSRLHLGRAARILRAARARRLPLRGAEPARLREVQLAGTRYRPTARTCWSRTSLNSPPAKAPTAASRRWWRTTGAAPSAGAMANQHPATSSASWSSSIRRTRAPSRASCGTTPRSRPPAPT